MNKNILAISVTILLIIGVLGFAVGRMTVPVSKPAQVAGALAGPDIISPYFSVGNVRQWYAQTVNLTQASTTVCTLQSPNATSTLEEASIYESVSSTTASDIDLGMSSNPTATTTILGSANVAANGQVNIAVASTTIFAPNTYLVVNQKAAAGLIANPTGQCMASWTQISGY